MSVSRFTPEEKREFAEGFSRALGLLSEEDEVKLIRDELQRLSDMDAISYFVPTVPVGEEWVVGYQGEILKFTTSEARAFLIGAAAVTRLVAARMGVL